jgi:probable addiction module antidote protein
VILLAGGAKPTQDRDIKMALKLARMLWELTMAKRKLQTRPYDAAAYLKTEQDCALYLQAAIDESDGDAALVIAALGDIARARGMMHLARETGLTREGLYKALSPEGNPSFATVMKVCKALGLKLHTEPAEA